MGTADAVQWILLILLLGLSAFFSSSETSLMSLNKIRIRYMVEQNIKGGDLIHKMMERPRRLLGTILVGNNIVNIGASAIATSLAIQYFGSKGVGIATAFMTIAVLIFGEITPKSLAARYPEQVAIRVSKGIYFCTIILNPLTKLINGVTGLLIRLLGGKTDAAQTTVTEEELKIMINMSHEDGVLEFEEQKMIHNVFQFTDSHVKDVMKPRNEVCFLSAEASYEEVISLFKEHRFSRMPVIVDELDQVIGIVNMKDLLFLEDPKAFDIHDWMHDAHFTYEFKLVRTLFEEMKKSHIVLSVVLDEYGGTAGIITIEDMIEEIVGEIEDEYETEKRWIERVKTDVYMVDGMVRIEAFNEKLGTVFESEHFETIGGFIMDEFGYLPKEKEIILVGGWNFEVISSKKNRIEKIKVSRVSDK